MKLNDFRNLDPVRDAKSLTALDSTKTNMYSVRNRVNTGRALLSFDYYGGVVSYSCYDSISFHFKLFYYFFNIFLCLLDFFLENF